MRRRCRPTWWWRRSSRWVRLSRVVPILEMPSDQMILDVGPKAVAHYTDVIGRCKTLLWNGPLGAFEINPLQGHVRPGARGRRADQGRQADRSGGGGDTVAALNAAGVTGEFSYVSTAAAPSSSWKAAKLPGIVALTRGAN